jgi:hypothetical protein
MQQGGFHVLGVSMRGQVVGYVCSEKLQLGPVGRQAECLLPEQVIDGETPLLILLGGLATRHWMFVRKESEIAGFVSRSDLQRAPVRMLLFGLISLFEMLLLELVQQNYSERSIMTTLTEKRLDQALHLHAERSKRGEELHLADCLQIADKRDLLLSVEGLVQRLGFESNKSANRFFVDVEQLRDRLVHANDLIAGSSWEEVLATTTELADFLSRCAGLTPQK